MSTATTVDASKNAHAALNWLWGSVIFDTLGAIGVYLMMFVWLPDEHGIAVAIESTVVLVGSYTIFEIIRTNFEVVRSLRGFGVDSTNKIPWYLVLLDEGSSVLRIVIAVSALLGQVVHGSPEIKVWLSTWDWMIFGIVFVATVPDVWLFKLRWLSK